METLAPDRTVTEIPLRHLAAADLEALSARMKLSLSGDDMQAIQVHYTALDREPTDVELEVIAQTWSEHCKHRIFNAIIEHTVGGKEEVIDGLFKTYIQHTTEALQCRKPDFVLSAFEDNAGFVRLDDEHAVCLKLETHNHPSAIEPYAGANTGLGGVIRDILGAGKGAKPVASLDVFCFGRPDTRPDELKADDVIHPIGILRGVVRGVRDYGNRMGIPTVGGAIHFADAYTYNPLVFCGTAGVIPIADIPKRVEPGHTIVLVGGKTGRDGLHGATFSSASLDGESHTEDQGAVQIGNPIEEKNVCDFVLKAREEGLIDCITDCGAGGLSNAAGEMLEKTGGTIYLEKVPLKEEGLTSWEIFLSESQERMVLGIDPVHGERLAELAAIYEPDCSEIGRADDSGLLRVLHDGVTVCELEGRFLHKAPRKKLKSVHSVSGPSQEGHKRFPAWDRSGTNSGDLKKLLGTLNICSREPIIREYDHEVQGNTVIKPLAGATGDAPQDASVIRVERSGKYIALGVSLLPQYESDPYRMGLSSVDEVMRQLVVAGADPDTIGLLDNYCVGNPDEPEELGKMVESIKGIADAALDFQAPFISGKDSFYNYFETDEGPVSIPITVVISGIGVIAEIPRVPGASLRRTDSRICLLGYTHSEMGGSAFTGMKGAKGGDVPNVDRSLALRIYRRFHQAIQKGWILSAHDLAEGGLAVALAETAFSLRGGLEIDLNTLPAQHLISTEEALFAESNSRILFEVADEHVANVTGLFDALPFAVIGRSVADHRFLRIRHNNETCIDADLHELKESWKNGLTPYY